MPNSRNPYDVLNVAQSAEPVVIEAAYRALMKKYHPDQVEASGDQASKAAEINRAFALLKDPAQRAAFDHQEWKRQQALRALGAPPFPPRRSLAGWSGWLVAVMLGAILAVLSVTPNQTAPSGIVAKTQTAAVGGSGSQPPYEDLWLPDSEGSAEVRRQAIETAAVPGAAVPVAGPISPEQSTRRFVSSGRNAGDHKRRRIRKSQSGPAQRSKADGDFLEREGYIY